MKRYHIAPGSRVDLAKRDPDDRGASKGGKAQAGAELARLNTRLEELQELLWAEHRHKVLIVLQGIDTAGKDGVIRHVFEGVNPQGVRVTSFKVPSERERDHDYLWRIHKAVPASGELVIFNRSHYEDVIVTRVHRQITREECERRYEQINGFEKMLAEEGTLLLKFFLHISKDEQKRRIEARLKDPRKHWKFNINDVRERRHWAAYQSAFETMLARTSTGAAPWIVVPANTKWYRNLVVARFLVDALEGLDMRFPKPTVDVRHLKVV
jgi:PPK2 family polyphosphate:nucleotide phosphotransferase